MMTLLNRLLLIIAIGMLAQVQNAVAQEQPFEAANNQDEVVNIEAGAPDSSGKLTIFRSGDKAEVNRYISRVVELKRGKALEVLPHVLRAVALEKGTARVLEYRPDGDNGVRQFIQVVTTVDQMPSVVETIEALDLPDVTSNPGVVRYSLRTRFRRASELATVLKGTVLSGEGRIYADDITNTLFIEDSHSDGKAGLSQVEFYDVPPPQIEFDIQIIEVRDDDAGKLGLDWDAWKRALGGEFIASGNWIEGNGVNAGLDWLLTLDAPTLAEFLNFATQRNHAKVVQRIKVAGNNQQSAQLSHWRRLPNLNSTGSGRADQDTVPGEYEEGLSVLVLPNISTDMVTAEIIVRSAMLSGYDERDQPILTRQDFDTIVTLEDMQTLRIGTIEKEVAVRYKRGIPLLRDLPVLGFLFGVEGRRTEKSQLHIVATPCYCNMTIYNARMKGDPGDILRMHDSVLPEFIKLEMLPVE